MSTFKDFNFSPEMDKAIEELGFESPTPIQLETIPLLLKEPTDFLGLAATGTGKTAAYGIPLLETMDANAKGVQALVLCPTRELAKQVTEQMNLLARYKKTKAIAIYGGSDYAGQLRALREGVSIVVGTPGRIIDHLERATLNLNHLKTVILDEADEMISMGFKTEIETILEKVQQEVKHQTWLFSATMSPDIRKIADQFLENPKQIQVNKTERVTTAVQQLYYHVREDEKVSVIEKVIDLTPGFYGLIFCQTKMLVTDLTQTLKADGYLVDCLHGDMEQNARERTMKAFKAKKVTVLICTDVASRGIDVKDLTHVINYSLPRELDLYVHRIGRTGRGGKEGIALSLVTPSHLGLVYRTEKATQSKMTKIPVPTDSDLMEIKIKRALETFVNHEETASLEAIKKAIHAGDWKETISNMDKEEIVARFLTNLVKTKAPKKSASYDDEDSARGGRGRFGGGRDSDRSSDRGSRGRDSFRGREGSAFGGGSNFGARPSRSFDRPARGSSEGYVRSRDSAPRDSAAGASSIIITKSVVIPTGHKASASPVVIAANKVNTAPKGNYAPRPKTPYKVAKPSSIMPSGKKSPVIVGAASAKPANKKWKKDFKASPSKSGGGGYGKPKSSKPKGSVV